MRATTYEIDKSSAFAEYPVNRYHNKNLEEQFCFNICQTRIDFFSAQKKLGNDPNTSKLVAKIC